MKYVNTSLDLIALINDWRRQAMDGFWESADGDLHMGREEEDLNLTSCSKAAITTYFQFRFRDQSSKIEPKQKVPARKAIDPLIFMGEPRAGKTAGSQSVQHLFAQQAVVVVLDG